MRYDDFKLMMRAFEMCVNSLRDYPESAIVERMVWTMQQTIPARKYNERQMEIAVRNTVRNLLRA